MTEGRPTQNIPAFSPRCKTRPGRKEDPAKTPGRRASAAIRMDTEMRQLLTPLMHGQFVVLVGTETFMMTEQDAVKSRGAMRAYSIEGFFAACETTALTHTDYKKNTSRYKDLAKATGFNNLLDGVIPEEFQARYQDLLDLMLDTLHATDDQKTEAYRIFDDAKMKNSQEVRELLDLSRKVAKEKAVQRKG